MKIQTLLALSQPITPDITVVFETLGPLAPHHPPTPPRHPRRKRGTSPPRNSQQRRPKTAPSVVGLQSPRGRVRHNARDFGTPEGDGVAHYEGGVLDSFDQVGDNRNDGIGGGGRAQQVSGQKQGYDTLRCTRGYQQHLTRRLDLTQVSRICF